MYCNTLYQIKSVFFFFFWFIIIYEYKYIKYITYWLDLHYIIVLVLYQQHTSNYYTIIYRLI